jgi:hypothetical protein
MVVKAPAKYGSFERKNAKNPILISHKAYFTEKRRKAPCFSYGDIRGTVSFSVEIVFFKFPGRC